MDNKTTFTVEATDAYGDNCFQDSAFASASGNSRKPEGYVEVYEELVNGSGNRRLVGKSNLVLYVGREWLATRAFNTDNINLASTKDQYICWLGLGKAGTMPGDPLIPVPPVNGDSGLREEIMINSIDAVCADQRDTGDLETTGFYKHPFDEVVFEEDDSNDGAMLVCKVVTTIEADDANASIINEAGLFTAESNSGGFAGPFNIFARISFPSIVKDENRRLIFVWYIYV